MPWSARATPAPPSWRPANTSNACPGFAEPLWRRCTPRRVATDRAKIRSRSSSTSAQRYRRQPRTWSTSPSWAPHASVISANSNPSAVLLSNGAEPNKELTIKDAHPRWSIIHIHFIGNVEGLTFLEARQTSWSRWLPGQRRAEDAGGRDGGRHGPGEVCLRADPLRSG